MESVTLFKAWELWATGVSVLDFNLWGIKILWWGRIGKVFQLIAAFTILAEIIGADAIRNFGKSLRRIITIKGSVNNILAILKVAVNYLRFSYQVIILGREKGEQVLDNVDTKWLIIVFMLQTFIFVFVFSVFETLKLGLLFFPIEFVGIVLITFVLTFLVITLTSAIFFMSAMLLDLIIIEPIAWIVDRQSIDMVVKLGSLVILLIGFHFDFLAS